MTDKEEEKKIGQTASGETRTGLTAAPESMGILTSARAGLSLIKAKGAPKAPAYFEKLTPKERKQIEEATLTRSGFGYEDNNEEQGESSTFNFEDFVTERNAKLIDLSENEDNLIKFFQTYLSQRRMNPIVYKYIQKVTQGEAGVGDVNFSSPTFSLTIKEISKEMYGRTGKAEEERISNAIYSLCEKVMFAKYKTSKGDRFIFSQHLLSIDNPTAKPAEDNPYRKILIAADIRLHDIFYNKLFSYFTSLPEGYLEIRQNYSGNEVYRVLEDVLLLNYRKIAVIGLKFAERAALKECREKKIKEVEAYLMKVQDEALLFELNIETLRAKLKQEYDSKKKGRFFKNIEKAIEGLKKMGIIEEGKIDETRGREGKIVFKYNINYTTPEDKSETLKFLSEEPKEEY